IAAQDDLRKYRCGLLDAESRLPEIVQRGSGEQSLFAASVTGFRCARRTNRAAVADQSVAARHDFWS
ncbi:MAG TPA: hypothetical protein VMP89_19975, partial [Solirubrobacteraceae bacterium]|nr:hypothetical protein [Solirubrobacteraceae bacterium]